jgi:hypothetical protein
MCASGKGSLLFIHIGGDVLLQVFDLLELLGGVVEHVRWVVCIVGSVLSASINALRKRDSNY